MAITIDDPSRLEGRDVSGDDGDKLGTVDAVYFDNDTDRPEWVSVKSGLFGTNVSLVPLATADFDGERLRVPFSKEQLKAAPHHDPGRELSASDEAELFRHYGISYGGGTVTAQSGTDAGGPDIGSDPRRTEVDYTDRDRGYSSTATGVAAGTAAGFADRDRRTERDEVTRTEGHDTSGPNTDDAMTRSEEQLRVGTETQAVGKARLRKHVVTEHEQVTVPVSREEVTVEREPITKANRGAAYDGPAISEEEHEVTLRAERPVVDTEAVPVERVKLGTQTVTEQETVGGEVRKEQIEVDGDGVRDRDLTDRDVRR